MAGNVDQKGQRRFGAQASHEAIDGKQSGSDAETSPVPSTTFSDFNDASSKADTESLPACNSSWSLVEDSHAPAIADSQDTIHPDWIVPSSPPSPPLRFDPRCRASSPDTPSPLYAKWQNPNSRIQGPRPQDLKQDKPKPQPINDVHPRSPAVYPVPPSLDSAPVSRAASWISSSSYSSTGVSDAAKPQPAVPPSQASSRPLNTLFCQPHMPLPHLPAMQQNSLSRPRAIETITGPPGQAQADHRRESHVLVYQASYPTDAIATEQSISFHRDPYRRGQEPPRTVQSYSTALGAQARPGLAKLSRFRQPTSSGKKRVVQPAKHAHRRSSSVQWQQFERWQKKSRARLRDLLFLLLAMFIGTAVIWRLCFPSSRSASSSRRRALKIPHLATLPEPHRDTMVIYRILGNDLPPRHEVGQTLRNLRFMLSHEDDFKHFASSSFSPYNLKIDKYYVLNRITNDTAVTAIMDLFAEYGVPRNRILNIPFSLEEYKRQEMRWDGGVAGSKNLWGIGTPPIRNITAEMEILADQDVSDSLEMREKWLKKSLLTKLRAMEYATHDKNLYAINNNGGRNFALEHGRALPNARWILPLDGNCFLTPPAMASLIQGMAGEAEGRTSRRHVIVPMNRLLSNSDVLEDNIAPWDSRDARLQDLHVETVDASEEPQVGFRWDSPVSYQLSMRYGRRSKLELLWRLGAIPFSRGLHTKRLPWEKQDHLYITPHSYASAVNSSLPQQQTKHGITNGDFIKAGWVHRLFSGDTSQEFSTTRAAELRRLNRMRGIITYLETLDLRASSMHNGLAADAQERIWHWDVRDLVAVKHASDDRQTPHSITSRLYQASERLVTGLLPLLDDKGVANYASSVKQKLLKDCLHLATIGYVITDHSFVQAAVKIAISVLPDLSAANYTSVLQLGQPPVGYAFPSLPTKLLDSQQQVTLPYDPLFFDVAALVDVVRLVRLSGSERTLRPAERMWIKDLDMVLAKHLQILLLSKDGIEMSSTPPSFETAMTYDKSVLVLSAYFNIPSLVSRVQHRHHLRYLDPATGQITDEASTPLITKLYETFRKGLNNVALDIKAEMDRDSSVHSIIEDLLRLSRAQ